MATSVKVPTGELAKLAYNRILDSVLKKNLESTPRIQREMLSIAKRRVYTAAEMDVISECLVIENTVRLFFEVARSTNVILSTIVAETLIQKALPRGGEAGAEVSCSVQPCVLYFHGGGRVVHYVVRVAFSRLEPSLEAYMHIDVGGGLYESSGLHGSHIVFNDENPEESKEAWYDQVSDEAVAARDRAEVLMKLWTSLGKDGPRRHKFFEMVYKSLLPPERTALHFSLGRLIPELDPMRQ